jgi:hypothetical protein
MQWWQMARQGLQGLFLVSLVFMGCAAPGGESTAEGCGGLEASVSCLDIVQIAPTYLDSPTSNVDAFPDTCFDPVTGDVTGVEPFTDHSAQITFTNTRFPTASGSFDFDIRILGFTVSYTLNQCPAQAIGCPPVRGFTVAESTLLVPAGGSVTATFPFVPLRTKAEYRAAGGELFSPFLPSYTVTYVFTAQTTRFNETITARGSAEFTIGAFNNCN